MAKQLSPALENYKVKPGTPNCGRCTKSHVEYNLYTISTQLIEAMIVKGSDLFEKKTKAEKSEEKKNQQ